MILMDFYLESNLESPNSPQIHPPQMWGVGPLVSNRTITSDLNLIPRSMAPLCCTCGLHHAIFFPATSAVFETHAARPGIRIHLRGR